MKVCADDTAFAGRKLFSGCVEMLKNLSVVLLLVDRIPQEEIGMGIGGQDDSAIAALLSMVERRCHVFFRARGQPSIASLIE